MPISATNAKSVVADEKLVAANITASDKIIITYRRAEKSDYESIAKLHADNYRDPSKLTEQDKRKGFLSIKFTPQQFEEMNNDLAVIVAMKDNKVVGYVCGVLFNYCQQFLLLKETIDFISLHKRRVNHEQITAENTFFYGPVCIAEGNRGKGVLEGLFDALKEATFNKKYKNCVLFMSPDNIRSYNAHRYRLNIKYIDTFFSATKNQPFIILARELAAEFSIQKLDFGAKLHSGEVPFFTTKVDHVRANNINYKL